jgi:hypothetical protein
MRMHLRMLLALIAVCSTGCSAFWPTVVRTSPEEPLFHTGFPLVGGARLDAALCSLATVGPEAIPLVTPPESTQGALPLEQACRDAVPVNPGERGRIGRLVSVNTEFGEAVGYLYTVPSAEGLVVAFSGLGMPAAGWINERFAELAAQRGLATFAPVRREATPIYFDPLLEARRGLDAALQIRTGCGIGSSREIRFVGISMGGLEALLANREALNQGMGSRAVVLDPVLDLDRVVENLDSFWHSAAVDAMQAYFKRILRGRYGESTSTTFREVLQRSISRPDAITKFSTDAPSAWLCAAKSDAYAVFLSDTDPVLGDDQRKFAQACRFPLKPAGAPGHTPLGCRPKLLEEMIDEVSPKVPAPAAYRLLPSKCLTGSACRSTPSRQRTLIATIGLPSGPAPRQNELIPQVVQKRWWVCFFPN